MTAVTIGETALTGDNVIGGLGTISKQWKILSPGDILGTGGLNLRPTPKPLCGIGLRRHRFSAPPARGGNVRTIKPWRKSAPANGLATFCIIVSLQVLTHNKKYAILTENQGRRKWIVSKWMKAEG